MRHSLTNSLMSSPRARLAKKPGDKVPSLSSVFQRLAIPVAMRPVLEGTFKTMCRLHDESRDHVWGYYIRNLARPMWLARKPNRVDILIGNPPWLAYRHMTPDMQVVFRRMSESCGLWAGAEVATHQDLSGLFYHASRTTVSSSCRSFRDGYAKRCHRSGTLRRISLRRLSRSS